LHSFENVLKVSSNSAKSKYYKKNRNNSNKQQQNIPVKRWAKALNRHFSTKAYRRPTDICKDALYHNH
jgi:energy-converting hydrogenase Eha subunit F